MGSLILGAVMLPTHYEILGVAESASPERIRAAYLGLMRRVHPDCATGKKRQKPQISATEANIAYSVLRDRMNRAHYDRQLALARYPAAGLVRIEHVSRYALAKKALGELLILVFLLALSKSRPAPEQILQLGARPIRWSHWYGSPAAERSVGGVLISTQRYGQTRVGQSGSSSLPATVLLIYSDGYHHSRQVLG